MRWPRLHLLLRLAVIALLVGNVVPEALAAFPLCKYDFAPARASTPETANSRAAFRHSHGNLVAHECVATMPDKQASRALHVVPDGAVAVLPATAHPVARLASRGPSPRGSPFGGSLYLSQRSSVLLLI